MTDTVYNSLPPKVRVLLEKEEMPTHNDPYPLGPKKMAYVPKEWVKHNERGHYDEWTWNNEYYKEICQKVGEDWYYATMYDILEWGIMENIALMLNKAEENNISNILDLVSKMNLNDAKYSHNRLYI